MKHITTLACHKDDCCPQVFVEEASQGREIIITDDYGQKIEMSKDNLLAFVNQARAGVFDTL